MALISFDVFWRDHGAARGAENTGRAFDEAAKKHEKMKDAIKVGALGMAVAVTAFGKKAIEIASDVSESQSKVQVVFGASAKSVLDFGNTSAKSLGISKASALEAAGTFGNLFVSLKLPQAEAAKMSTKMITLAADMASFNNASPEEALEAIRSGLVGETEPLRRFGVNMNDATLRTQALKMGLIDNVKDGLDPAVKAQAAYGLMLSQTGTAQGDFARTSGGLANQQRLLAAQWSDLQAELGEKLLPAVNKVLKGMLSLVGVLSRNQDVVVPLAAAAAVLAASIWLVNKAALGAAKAMSVWNVILNSTALSVLKARTAMMGLYSTTVIAAAGAAVFAVAWGAKTLNATKAADISVQDLTKSMIENKDATALSAGELELFAEKNGFVANHLLGKGSGLDDSTKALEEFGHAAHNALDQGWVERANRFMNMSGSEKAFREETAKLDESFAAMVSGGHVFEAQEEMKKYAKALADAGRPVSDLAKLFPEYNKAVQANHTPVKMSTMAAVDHAKAVEQDTLALRANANALIEIRGSENGFEASLDDATQSLEDNGATLNKHTEKGRNNRAALDDMAVATLKWKDSAVEAGRSQKEQNKILADGRDAIVKMAIKFGMGKTAAKKYADEVLGIPKKVSSTVSLYLKNNIPRTIFGVRVGGIPGSRQGGVTYAKGGPVWGEGTETSDSIPALLSHNEHVLTAREVRGLGGHSEVEKMRKNAVAGFATGGAALAPGLSRNMERALVAITGGTASSLSKVIQKTAERAIGFNPSLSGALNFARQQVGKPYIWGGVGPRGYDCSGAMSALLNVVQGLNPYHRRFATGSFPSAGFVPGPGSFMIGSRRGAPGHMAGTINGVNVESSGSVGFHMGSGARGARDRMFSGVWHLKGYRGGGAVSGDAPFDLLSPQGDNYLGNALRERILSSMPSQIFDAGGVLPTGLSVVNNKTGKPEALLPPDQIGKPINKTVADLAKKARDAAERARQKARMDALIAAAKRKAEVARLAELARKAAKSGKGNGTTGGSGGGGGGGGSDWQNVRLHPSDIRAIGAHVGLQVYAQLVKLRSMAPGPIDPIAGGLNLTSAGGGLTQVVAQTVAATASSGAAGVNATQLADTMVKALSRSGLTVVMDGQTVGRLQGRQADLLGRAN